MNETQYYNLENTKFEVCELTKSQGEFKNESGQVIPWSNYRINIKINDYPVIFKFKLDRVLAPYIEEALMNNEGQ